MKALVCGAGIAGLTLAWWLRRDGWDVTLVERAGGPRAEGYLMDFFGSGWDVAERMGLLPALARAHTRVTELSYLDSAGRRTGGVRYEAMRTMLRQRVFSLMRGDLERVLRDALDPLPGIRYGTSIAAIEPIAAGVRVGLTDGTSTVADLVVGADGVHSRVRHLLCGPEERFLRYLGFHTASYLFDDPDLAARIGNRFAVCAAPGRQVGVYPAADGRLATSLVHAAADPALPADPAGAVRTAYRGLGGWIDRVLAAAPDDGLYYDQVAQIELDRWSGGAVTLVGDACQAVSLLGGQGASLAMGGAWVLADELRAAGGTDLSAALRRYEQRMLPAVRRKQAAARRGARWMVPDTTRRIWIRDRLMGLANLPGGPVLLRPTMATARASVVVTPQR